MSGILPEELRGRSFTYQEALKHGLTQYSVQKLLESNDIERVERGLYQSTEVDLSDEDLYRRAVKTVGEPAVVCLLSALSYYDLTDTIPKRVWLMVPAERRSRSRNIKLYRARDPNWTDGVVVQKGYSITSFERTIVETLALRSMISPRLGINALKQAISEKRTTTDKILRMADTLDIKHRVLPIIEALS